MRQVGEYISVGIIGRFNDSMESSILILEVVSDR